MLKVIYSYTHDTDVLGVFQFPPEAIAYRNEFLEYAQQHGMQSAETRLMSPTVLLHEVLWNSKEDWDAFQVWGGEQYAQYVQNTRDMIVGGGGNMEIVEREV